MGQLTPPSRLISAATRAAPTQHPLTVQALVVDGVVEFLLALITVGLTMTFLAPPSYTLVFLPFRLHILPVGLDKVVLVPGLAIGRHAMRLGLRIKPAGDDGCWVDEFLGVEPLPRFPLICSAVQLKRWSLRRWSLKRWSLRRWSLRRRVPALDHGTPAHVFRVCMFVRSYWFAFAKAHLHEMVPLWIVWRSAARLQAAVKVEVLA